MRGFIEVNADLQYDPRMIAVDLIESFCNHEVVTASMSYCVKETYEEIKALIEAAQKEGGVSIQYAPYIPPQEPKIVPLLQPWGLTIDCAPLDFPKWTCNTKEDS